MIYLKNNNFAINLVFPIILLVFLVIPVAADASFDFDLKYGSTGTNVFELQEFLTDQGVYAGPVTGNFFSLTLRAVKDFQSREGIKPVSGYFGPKTRARVNVILAQNLKQSNAEPVGINSDNSNAVVNLPNGAIVELDKTGQIVKYIKEAATSSGQINSQTNISQQTQIPATSTITTSTIPNLSSISFYGLCCEPTRNANYIPPSIIKTCAGDEYYNSSVRSCLKK